MRPVAWVTLLAASGCGRLQFDATPDRDASGGTANDGGGDGGTLADASTSFIDAPPGAMAWSAFSPTAGAIDWYTTFGFSSTDLWVGGLGGAISRFDGTQWLSAANPLGGDANTLWGASATDLWAGGPSCAVARWNGSSFSSATIPGCSNKSIFGIGGANASDVWIAGVGGTLVHYTGTFTNLAQATNIDLWAIAAASINDAYIVGTKGTILHWTGTALVDESLGQNIIVSSVWYDGATTYWAVGTGGAIYRKTGTSVWTSVASPTSTFLYAVMGVAPNDIWAAGDFGTLIHYNGTSWTSVTGSPNVTLRAFARVGSTLRLVGNGGTILTYQ